MSCIRKYVLQNKIILKEERVQSFSPVLLDKNLFSSYFPIMADLWLLTYCVLKLDLNNLLHKPYYSKTLIGQGR